MSKPTGIVIDVETTGLDASKHEIIEIGAVIFDSDFNEIDCFESLIRPEMEWTITEKAMEVNGLDLNKLRTSPLKSTVRNIFLEWVTEHMVKTEDGFLKMLGHSGGLDERFMIQLLSFDVHNSIMRHIYDTKIFAEGLKSAGRITGITSLACLMEELKISFDGELHRALSDARLTLAVYKGLVKLSKKRKRTKK